MAPEIDATIMMNPPEDRLGRRWAVACRAPDDRRRDRATLGRTAKTAQAVASGGARAGGRCAVTCVGGNATETRGDTSQINGGGMTLTANAGRMHRDKCLSTWHS